MRADLYEFPTREVQAIATGPPQTTTQPREWLEAVAEVSRAVNSSAPLENVLNAVAETTCRLLAYDFSAVLLVDLPRQRLLIRGSHGLSRSYVKSVNTKRPIRLGNGAYGEGPSSRAFRSLEPVVVRDFRRDPAVGPWAGVASEQGLRSLAVVPLVVSGDAIGTLNCYTRAVHHFAADEILLIRTMANQAASAIEAARLREEERATIARLEDARRSLELQTRILERSEEIHTELTTVVLADAGLDAIAAALARMLDGAVVIDDTAGTILAKAGGDIDPAALGTAARLLKGSTGRAARLADLGLEGVTGVAIVPGLPGAFVIPVTIGRDKVARLWLVRTTEALGSLEQRALEHGGTVIALELLKERIAIEVELRLRGELLDDLLDGQISEQRSLESRASHLGFSLTTRHTALVLVLGVDRQTDDGPDVLSNRRRHLRWIIGSTLRRLGVQALVGERDDAIVVLVGEVNGRRAIAPTKLAEALLADTRRAIDGASPLVAVGPWVDRIADIGSTYEVARGALVVARQSGAQDRIVTLDELGVYGLLLTVGRLDRLTDFAARMMTPIRDYDARRGTDLLLTLKAYLRNSCKTAAASAELVVHPNTVAYRIGRIEALLGVDFHEPEALLAVQLALVVDEVSSAASTRRPRRSKPDDEGATADLST